jgi:hypothetical protein
LTTIAVNRKQIAADRQANHSGGLKFKVRTKLYSFDNPMFYKRTFHVGLAGNIDIFPPILEYFADPTKYEKPPKIKGGEGIILSADGKIWTFSNPSLWLYVDQSYYAIGSGMNFAMGAMAAGSTPYEAVKYAEKLDPQSGMGVTKIDLE